MDFTLDWVVDETTKVVTRFEFADEEPWDGYKTNNPGGTGYDDNVELYFIYLEHKFPTNTALYAGKMEGGTWATYFQDNMNPAYRVKVIQFFPWGLIVGLAQKLDEQGYAQAIKDGEEDDGDAYAIGAVFAAGPVKIMPLFFHILPNYAAIDQEDGDVVIDYYTLDVTGSFGMIGFEAVYSYINEDWDQGRAAFAAMKDSDNSAFYAKVWANFDAFNVGVMYTWAGYDSDADAGTPTGADFDETYIMGEELEGGAGASAYQAAIFGGSSGWSIYQLFADFAFGKFSLNGSITYYDSTCDEAIAGGAASNTWRDSSAWEYNIGAAYKITDNLTYDVGLGVCNIDLDATYGGADPEDLVYAFHRIKVSF
jgi:hypothetical protein